MEREEIMEMVAEWFEIEPDEDGTYNIDDYDWTAGCSMGRDRKWLCLAEVVRMIESMS